MKCSVIGIDLSKNIFHIVAINHRGKVLKRIKCRRESLLVQIRRFPADVKVCMEACQGSHEWCREIKKAGYEALQIPAQHVKRYARYQKNDYNDSEAIAEAGSRSETRFVPVKTAEQQELEAVLGARERLIRAQTALMNQARGYLAEQGKVLPQGKAALVKYLSSDMPEIGATLKQVLRSMLDELSSNELRIKQFDTLLEQRARACSVIKRLKTIPGVGTKTAVALSTLSGNAREFKKGRQFAANLGLVPRQISTGGKTKLAGISKHGDRMRRSLLILGAHSVVRAAVAHKKKDIHSLWIRGIYDKKGANLASVALANKNARIAWRIITTPGATYSESLCH